MRLLGGVALLLWGLRRVEQGVNQAFGADLRRAVGRSMTNPLTALLTGLGVTGLLQSSTATAMITTSFVRQGLVGATPALAVLLGADVGTSLVVQALSLRMDWLSPVMLLIGVVGLRVGRSALRLHICGALIGLGLMLLALHQIVAISEPLRDAEALQAVLLALSDEPLLLLLVGALLTWLAHSSVAMVLLVSALTAAGLLELPGALLLVLGANLGAGLPPLVAMLGASPEVRRVPLGNLIFKATGVAVAFAALPWLIEVPWLTQGDLAWRAVNFHLVFNVALAAVFVWLTRPMAALLKRWVPDAPESAEEHEPRYLDRSAIATPSVALAHAERETLRMGDIVQQMLGQTILVLRDDDERLLHEIEERDNVVDALHRSIKLYVTEVSREVMSKNDSVRATEVMALNINLEHIGDIIDKNLMELAAKKIRRKLRFSDEGYAEIRELHAQVMENLKLAFVVFMSGQVEMARQLIEQKAHFREMFNTAGEKHLVRLRTQRIESVESSSIHLDVLNEIRRINSHITSVAYPILDHAGELLASRLRDS